MKRLLVVMLLAATPSAQADVYTWTDARRIVHYTNKEYEIPTRYKARAKPLHLEAVQAGASATPSTPTPTPQQAAPAPPATQPLDKSAPPQDASSNPAPQPVAAPAGALPAPNIQIRPRVKRKIRSGGE